MEALFWRKRLRRIKQSYCKLHHTITIVIVTIMRIMNMSLISIIIDTVKTIVTALPVYAFFVLSFLVRKESASFPSL